MKQTPMDMFTADLEDHGIAHGMSAAMEVDDSDALDFFGGPDTPLSAPDYPRVADADFFNSFQDDFNDSDI